MKHAITTTLAILACFTIAFTARGQDSGIAVVQMRKLVEGHHSYDDLQKRLENEREELMDKLKKMGDDAMELAKKLRTIEETIQSPLLTDEARNAQKLQFNEGRKLLQDKRTMLMQAERSAKAKLRQSSQQAQAKLMKEIAEQIRIYAEKKVLKLVVDNSGAISSVMYAAPKLDITNEVLGLINAGHEEEMKKRAAEKAKAKSEKVVDDNKTQAPAKDK